MEDLTGSLSESILKAVEAYNRYRSPEATAKLVEVEKHGFVIEFEGTFCSSCGVQEYFEDFIYELEDITSGFRAEIKKTEPSGPQRFMVHYVVNRDLFDTELDEESLFSEFLKERGMSFSDYLKSNACTKDVIQFHFRTWKSGRNE
jgi:hypothetical protein